MGEYYSWVNINKKEYIAPCDFGLGSKLWGAVVAEAPPVNYRDMSAYYGRD